MRGKLGRAMGEGSEKRRRCKLGGGKEKDEDAPSGMQKGLFQK